MSKKIISLEHLKYNNGLNGRELWVLVDGKIYNLTKYDHPGGKEVFEQDPDNYEDLYEKFMENSHSSTADRIMKKYYIGDLEIQ